MQPIVNERSTWICTELVREIGMLLSQCVFDISEREVDDESPCTEADVASQQLCLMSLMHCRGISFDFLDDDLTFSISVDTVSNNTLSFGGCFTDDELERVIKAVYAVLSNYNVPIQSMLTVRQMEPEYLLNNSLWFGIVEVSIDVPGGVNVFDMESKVQVSNAR